MSPESIRCPFALRRAERSKKSPGRTCSLRAAGWLALLLRLGRLGLELVVRLDLHLDAAVLGAPVGGLVRGDRHHLAVAFGALAGRRDALPDQEAAHRVGAPLGQ